MSTTRDIQRQPAELRYQKELEALQQIDDHPVPPGWRLSPIAVERFICGDKSREIQPKFVAEPGVVRRVVISLCGVVKNRG